MNTFQNTSYFPGRTGKSLQHFQTMCPNDSSYKFFLNSTQTKDYTELVTFGIRESNLTEYNRAVKFSLLLFTLP